MPAEKSAKPPKSAPGPATKAPAAPAAKTPAAPAKAASKKPAPAPTAPAAKTIKAVPVKNTAEHTKGAAAKPANNLPKSTQAHPPHHLPKRQASQRQQPGRPCRKHSTEKTPDPGCHRRCYYCGCGCNQDAPRQARPQAKACQQPECRPGQHR